MPLLSFHYSEVRGSLRGADAPLKTNLPLPLVKGKGIQGIGLLIIKERGIKFKVGLCHSLPLFQRGQAV